jgi:hypothetical protein
MTSLNETSLGCFAQGVEGDMTRCVVEGVFSAGPSPGVMGLLLGGTVLTSLYVAGDGNITVPAVATILFGALLIPTLPPQFQLFAYTITALGITAAAFAAYTRFTTRGGFR